MKVMVENVRCVEHKEAVEKRFSVQSWRRNTRILDISEVIKTTQLKKGSKNIWAWKAEICGIEEIIVHQKELFNIAQENQA